MAKLNAKRRNALSKKSFALPGRRYPINDASHARNALARVSQHGSPSEQKKVRAAVARKFPGIGKSSRKSSSRKSASRKATTRRPMARKAASRKASSKKVVGARKKASSKKASGKRY